MRPRVLVASIAAHGVLAALLVVLAAHPTPIAPPPMTIEIIAPPETGSDPIPEPPVAKTGPDPMSEPRVARTGADPTPKSHGGKAGADPIARVRYEGAANGDGNGQGDGVGDGIGGEGGLGIGDASSAVALANLVPPPPPAPEKASKARPAILIYPKKHGADDDPDVFVAQVTIDDDGYVVGARVTSGEGGVRGEQAAALIWRFRYDPARDDDGRAIRSTLEQPFLVGR